LKVDLEKGSIKNLTTGITYQASPFPGFMREIISLGGLVEYVRKRLQAKD
jgi:3-isopropylmalate/(R)-2-methylmalate dehydratase small subunit